jgi:signal transduction histidine kinase/CheY-like chemotaxis protein
MDINAYTIFLLVASQVVVVYAAVGFSRRQQPGAVAFAFMMLAVAWWSMGNSFELLAQTLETKVLMAQIQYLGIVWVSPLFLLMAGRIAGHAIFATRRLRLALFVVPVVHIILVWTNGLTGLVWAELALGDGPFGPELALVRGPAFWMNLIYAYGTLVAGQVILGVGVWRERGERRLQYLVIFIAALFPWVGNIVTIFVDTNAPADLTPVFFLLTGGAVAFAMLRFRLFRLVPIAREVAMEELSEGVIAVGMDGRVVDMNNAASAMTGWSLRAAQDVTLERVLSGLAVVEGDLPQTVLTRAQAVGARLYSARGRTVISGDRPRGRLVVLRDVTEERRAAERMRAMNDQLEQQIEERTAQLRHQLGVSEEAEARLSESNTQLEQALHDLETAQRQLVQEERLRVLGQMTSGIAHEFNNALSPISGFSELLLLRPELRSDPEKAEHYLRSINTAARDAARIIGRLREFSKGTGDLGALEPVDLNGLLDETVSLTRPRWQAQSQAGGTEIHLITALGGDPVVRADATALREVFTNLIFNASDAMPDGGELRVESEVNDATAVVRVRDGGTGMSPETLAHCFDPFYSTKGDKGTGLGLALVASMVERHGGTIEADSTLGRGTTFTVRLPLVTERSSTGTTPSRAASGASLRVMVVDDETPVREVMSVVLKEEGHLVWPAASGREALDLLRNGHFDVLVTNLAMDGLRGDALAAQAKDLYPDLTVVLVSGFLDPEIDLNGVDTVLAKPVSASALRDAIADARPSAATG